MNGASSLATTQQKTLFQFTGFQKLSSEEAEAQNRKIMAEIERTMEAHKQHEEQGRRSRAEQIRKATAERVRQYRERERESKTTKECIF